MAQIFPGYGKYIDGRRCNLCHRFGSLYGLRDVKTGYVGWCSVCQRLYRQNGQEYFIRPLGSHVALSMPNVRDLVVVALVGSVWKDVLRAQKDYMGMDLI